MQPQIIVLKEGTNSSQGRPQLLSNIGACSAVADAVRTTLGPRGMDKLIVNEQGKATVSNDGATIMNLLNIVHPAARTLVDIAKSQDAEVGDGTTSVVLLAAEFLSQAKPYIEDGVHPQCIVAAYRRGVQHLIEHINKVAVQVKSDAAVNGGSGSVNGSGDVKGSSGGSGGGGVSQQHYNTLLQCAGTALQSKLVHQQRDMFARMVVDAVLSLDHLMPINMIGIKHVQGGALEDSELVEGVAFKKTFSYAGFEMQPKSYTRPRIALLNIELELKAERDNAEIRLDNVQEYQRVVDAEWQILYDKLALIHKSGARVVLSRLPIGDVATQYFADRDMFCAGRVPEDDLRRTLRACGGAIVTTAHDLNDSSLGTCGQFVERQIGGERYNVFSECPQTRTCTLVLRGGTEQFLEETERSLHDAIMIVRRTIKHNSLVGGGGAIEMVLSTHLRQLARQVPGKEQLLLLAMARALEVIPRQLCDNAGFDSTAIVTQLRQRHAPASNDSGATCWHGVDIANETVADNMTACVWEPALVKVNALTAAAEAACLVLAVDETIKSPRSGGEGGVGDQPVPNMGRGRPM